jgi:UDP-3-O-[3-hydroxymyristoyl] N-acetylglucosamine deacetylase/3-hydroxyacyl-[acyl-carrier-protein] dehydratase
LRNGSTQKTIAKRVSLSGVGLHTGKETEISFCPAKADEGIRFVRLDLPDRPVVRASVDSVSLEDVVLQTAIGKGDAQIRTVEHVLAALVGLEIDNVTLELTSGEPPVGDGSARPFVETIQKAGIVDLGVPRRFIEVKRPICMVEDAVEMVAIPAPRLEVTFKIDYDHPAVGIRAASFAIDPETFSNRIAGARTFCFKKDVEEIRKKGFIRGGSLENAIVVGDEGITQELRYRDEIVRHKVLDVLGDMALLGRPLKAHIIAVRSGHSYNVKFVKKILEEERAGLAVSELPLPIEADTIRRILPHRFPFLLVDRVVELDRENLRAVAIKNVTVNEPFFQGHWPEQSVMPGVLQIEALAQVGGILLLTFPEHRGKLAYLAGIDGVKLRKAVIPGDQLRIEVEIQKVRGGRTGKLAGKIYVEDQVVSEAFITFMLIDG